MENLFGMKSFVFFHELLSEMFPLSARPPSVALLKLRTVNWETVGGNLEGWKDVTLGKTTGKVSCASFGQRVLMKTFPHCRAGTLGEAWTVITSIPQVGAGAHYPNVPV